MEKVNIKKIQTYFDGMKIDFFLTCASFEKRSSFLLNHLSIDNIENFGIFATVDFDKCVEAERELICKSLMERSCERIDLKISDPVFSFISIVNYCNILFTGDGKKLIVDVSTFTHEHLLVLFRVLFDHKRDEDIIFLCYTSASSYSFNISEVSDKWLTKGVKELRSIIGFPGYFDPTKKNHLIIVVGFEVERVVRVIESFDFEMVTLVVGARANPMNIKNQLINEERYDQVLNLFSNSNKLEVSLEDPIEVRDTILKYISRYDEYNTVIAPMNNKISTLGVGYAAIENADIQLFYMQANIYNIDGYSETGENVYVGQM